jgi:phage tail-like protein
VSKVSTPSSNPNQGKNPAITLEDSVTHDLAFGRWAGNPNGEFIIPVQTIDIILEGYAAGQQVLTFHIAACWPSEFVGAPELDANSNDGRQCRSGTIAAGNV